MTSTFTAAREGTVNSSQNRMSHPEPLTSDKVPAPGTENGKRETPARVSRLVTDDEILGIDSAAVLKGHEPRLSFNGDDSPRSEEGSGAIGDPGAEPSSSNPADEPENLRAVFDANPELRSAWQDVRSYRETFATPEEARAANAILADVDRMDALFFSRRPEDHAELARLVAGLDPAAFASLAQAMDGLAKRPTGGLPIIVESTASAPARIGTTRPQSQSPANPAGTTQAQADFFHATNAAAVDSVLGAIETHVDRLLPEGISKSARNRVVGEIYRELDTTLRSNQQLTRQMRDAFRSGGLDADHQRALVSLLTGRARQVLPGVAKRVLNEWTSTVVTANQDRRTRQRMAERRVDIAGSSGGSTEGPRSTTPRDIDYARMSDADILNL